MTEPTTSRGLSAGCLAWLGALLAFSAILGAGLWITLLSGSDDQPPTAPTGTGASPTGTVAALGCTDVTGEFQRSAIGPGVEYVRGVCWDSDGHLRVEIELAADINVDSTPMRALCAALSDFVDASGRPWQGFTGYSSSPVTPGQPMLTRAQPNQPCQNPFQR